MNKKNKKRAAASCQLASITHNIRTDFDKMLKRCEESNCNRQECHVTSVRRVVSSAPSSFCLHLFLSFKKAGKGNGEDKKIKNVTEAILFLSQLSKRLFPVYPRSFLNSIRFSPFFSNFNEKL